MLDGSGIVVTKTPRPRPTPTPAPTSTPTAELPQVDGANAAQVSEANRSFLSNLTPAQQILLAAGVALAAVSVRAGFRWGPQLWRTKVKPTVGRLREKFARRGDRDTPEG